MTGPKRPLRLLGNARRLLDVIAEEGPMTVARLAEALDMPRSTVFRLAEGLADVDLVALRENGTVDLATRWLYLADVAQAARTEWASARRSLPELAAQTQCTAVLSVLHDDVLTCLDWVPGRVNEVLLAKPGRELPLHAGAEGRAVLAALPPADLERVLARAPFDPHTPATLVGAADLRDDVARTRRTGYVVSLDDTAVGLGSIAAPLHDAQGRELGSVAVTSFSDDIARHAQEWGNLLRRMVAHRGEGTF